MGCFKSANDFEISSRERESNSFPLVTEMENGTIPSTISGKDLEKIFNEGGGNGGSKGALVLGSSRRRSGGAFDEGFEGESHSSMYGAGGTGGPFSSGF